MTSRKTARQRFKPLSAPLDKLPEGLITDEDLLAKYDRLIIRVAHTIQETYHLSAEDGEDMAQAARIRLLRVPQAKRHIAVWVRVVINNACRNELAKIRAAKEPLGKPILYLDREWDVDEPGATSLADTIEDTDETHHESLERSQLARTAFSSLNTEEQLVMALKLGLDGSRPIHNLRTLSRKSGVREARLLRVISRAMLKMQQAANAPAKESAA